MKFWFCSFLSRDSTSEDKSVRPISVKCADGTVTWRSPYGGLQITVLPPGVRGRHFEACFFASASYAAIRLSIEHGDTLRTIYVLKAPNGTVSGSGVDNDDNDIDDRCFRFTRGRHPLTLYAEVDAAMTSLAVGRLTVEYSVRRIRESEDGTLDDMAGRWIIIIIIIIIIFFITCRVRIISFVLNWRVYSTVFYFTNKTVTLGSIFSGSVSMHACI